MRNLSGGCIVVLLLAAVGLIFALMLTRPVKDPPKEDVVQEQEECPVLIWSDEFNGTALDTENTWEYQIGNGCDVGLCGWGNNELETYTDQNAIVSNGTLKIVVQRENDNAYTSSRIRTKNGAAKFVHGRFEARIRLPIGQGIWPAFWMMPTDSVHGIWPLSGEIDIMENIGHEVSTIHGTLHYSSDFATGYHEYKTQSVNLNDGTRFADDFHEFAIEKSPNKIQWFLDGAEYFAMDRNSVSTWPFEEAFHFILNVAVGGLWPGNPDETTKFPQVLEVDYIRVYQGGAIGKLVGPRVVRSNQTGIEYSVLESGDGIWNSFHWVVPDTAKIVEKAGNSIVVDFGETPGRIKVTAVSDRCNQMTRQFSMGVSVSSSVDLIFEDGGDRTHDAATLVSATGTYTIVPNPNKSTKQTINPSKNVVEYTRNDGVLYDTIFFTTLAITNPDDYVFGPRRRFSLDVFTTEATGARAGTIILLQLENSNRANPGNYPIGRHSRFQVIIPETNSNGGTWQHLTFNFLDQPDSSETQVDTLVLMFHPNSRTKETFYFDNLESSSVADPIE